MVRDILGSFGGCGDGIGVSIVVKTKILSKTGQKCCSVFFLRYQFNCGYNSRIIMTKQAKKKIAGWDSWDPRQYLDTYYAVPMGDTYETLNFLLEELSPYKKSPFKKALEFGAGPTLFGSLAIVSYVEELHLSDYLKPNLFEINKWLFHHKDAFNWDACTEYILTKENTIPTKENIINRSDELRQKLKKLLYGDIAQSWPLLDHEETYDLLVSLYCADSVTNSKKDWHRYMNNLFKLAAPGGVIIIGALRNCSSYRVGKNDFPCANINEKDFEQILSEDSHNFTDIRIEVRNVPDCKEEGFIDIVFARIALK